MHIDSISMELPILYLRYFYFMMYICHVDAFLTLQTVQVHMKCRIMRILHLKGSKVDISIL